MKLLREDGLSAGAALDRTLSLVPGASAWGGQRIREIQAAPHTVTKGSLLRGYGDVCKRVTVLADAARMHVRKSGGGVSHEAALHEVLDGGGLDDAA